MDAEMVEETVKVHLAEIRSRLERAAGVAKAADACARAGNVEKAIEIALDIEQPIHEANSFLNAASMLYRLRRT